jgi:hypothetical protein
MTHNKEKDSHRVHLPSTSMHFTTGNRILLSPKSKSAYQSDYNGNKVASDGEWNANRVE